MPILDTVYDILYRRANAERAIRSLGKWFI